MHKEIRSQVGRAILDYFYKHPEAQDTLSGIAQWWLADDKVKTRTATIKEELDKLIAEGLVLAHKGTDSQIRYRVNKQRLKDMRRLLDH